MIRSQHPVRPEAVTIRIEGVMHVWISLNQASQGRK